jgi:hypothetical protein
MSLILSGTDGLSDVDGSAATPAIRGTDTNTGIFFGADIIGFSEGGVEAMRINSAGNLQTIGTISVGNATPSTSGAGITFPSAQSASSNANTLDDYEEGTWTPVIEGTTTAGTVTYAARNAKYTKIVRLVILNTYVSWSSGTGTGNLRMSGLPFTEGGDSTYGVVTLSEFDNISMTALYYPSAYIGNNTSQINFEQAPTGGGGTIAIPYDGAGQVILTVTYQTST